MTANLENSAVATGLEKVSFHSNPKERQCQRMLKLPHNCTHLCCCCQVASVVSDSVRTHRRQPTRYPCPWDSPGKNTGVGCHFLLQCMTVKSPSDGARSCTTLSDPRTAAYQAPPSIGFSRQEYWSGMPLPSPHASKVMLKILQARLQQYVNRKFLMFKLVLEKAEEPEIKLPTSAGSWKKQESSRKTPTSALLTMPKPLTVWITINCGKF